jgi:hypothetical protein
MINANVENKPGASILPAISDSAGLRGLGQGKGSFSSRRLLFKRSTLSSFF